MCGELQYTMERAVIMMEGDVLSATDLIFFADRNRRAGTQRAQRHEPRCGGKNTILRVIEKHHGNISKAAENWASPERHCTAD